MVWHSQSNYLPSCISLDGRQVHLAKKRPTHTMVLLVNKCMMLWWLHYSIMGQHHYNSLSWVNTMCVIYVCHRVPTPQQSQHLLHVHWCLQGVGQFGGSEEIAQLCSRNTAASKGKVFFLWWKTNKFQVIPYIGQSGERDSSFHLKRRQHRVVSAPLHLFKEIRHNLQWYYPLVI